MVAETEVIMFAIRALTRINEQYRLGYADSARSAPLTLPLPNFPAAVDRAAAEAYYRLDEGQEFLKSHLRVKELFKRLDDTGQLSLEQDKELIDLFREHRALQAAQSGDPAANGVNVLGIFHEDIVNLLTIRQWQDGKDPNPTVLRRAAGTLVSIAVDYVVSVPDAWSPHTSRGQAIKGFLSTFEAMKVDFVEDGRTELLQKLFVAAVETVRDNPQAVTGDKRWSALLQNVAKDLYDSSTKLIAQSDLTLNEKDRIRDWTQAVFRSVLKSTTATVFADSANYLGVRGPVQVELVSGVSKALLAPLLDKGSIDPNTLFTSDSLERAAKAALAVVARHPELVKGDNEFLGKLVSATSRQVSESAQKLGPEMLPEIVRLVLENSTANLELLLPDKNQPEKHLIITASRTVLERLSAPPAAGQPWQIRFTSADAMQVLEVVTVEVAQNPAWLVAQAAGADSMLSVVVADVLAVLRKTSPKLTRETGVAILAAALRAVGKRIEFTEEDPNRRKLVGLAVEAVLAKLFAPGFGAKAAWVLAREGAVERVTSLALEALAKRGVTVARIDVVKLVLDDAQKRLETGQAWSWELLAEAFEEKLAAAV